ncbi:MAG: class I SAM-dependent methyltransferase [Acidobacteria bacterium]|nr:class I SAM-dependent methyltransferase [Acidobacteriota bacterium]
MKPRPPVTAHERFQQRAGEFEGLDLRERFRRIRETNLWGSDDSVSGLGSELAATERLRTELPEFIRSIGAKSLLDIPCGDFGWLSRADLSGLDYTGADIVEALVAENSRSYPKRFRQLDLCASALPRVDLVLCRDCLVHLSFGNIMRAVENLRRSGSEWLLTTHFLECESNSDIADGDWRMLNFELEPFCWGPPARLLVEGCTESGGGYADKTLALWPISGLTRNGRR